VELHVRLDVFEPLLEALELRTYPKFVLRIASK
jgi:hypothetical protein